MEEVASLTNELRVGIKHCTTEKQASNEVGLLALSTEGLVNFRTLSRSFLIVQIYSSTVGQMCSGAGALVFLLFVRSLLTACTEGF